jgi:GxxExxY protein
VSLLFEELTEKIIGLSIEIHKELGPGLLENVYKQCLIYEFEKADIKYKVEQQIPIIYKDVKINCCYKLDMIIEDKIIIELKSVEKLLPIHEAQILTYLKITKKRVGLLINFNEKLLKDGIKRFIL